MTDNNPTETSVLTLTDKALAKVLELRTDEAAPESLALWIEISGTSGDAYTYDMYFQATSDAGPDAWTGVQDGLTIVVPAASAPNMVGSVLDLNQDLMAGGMSIRNPNRPPVPQASPTMTGPPPDLSGDVAQRVIQVLDAQINPSIAAHGGRADLVAVDRRGCLPAPERRLRRLRDGRRDPQPGHRGGHQAISARDRPHRRRDRSRLGHQPVLRAGQEVNRRSA